MALFSSTSSVLEGLNPNTEKGYSAMYEATGYQELTESQARIIIPKLDITTHFGLWTFRDYAKFAKRADFDRIAQQIDLNTQQGQEAMKWALRPETNFPSSSLSLALPHIFENLATPQKGLGFVLEDLGELYLLDQRYLDAVIAATDFSQNDELLGHFDLPFTRQQVAAIFANETFDPNTSNASRFIEKLPPEKMPIGNELTPLIDKIDPQDMYGQWVIRDLATSTFGLMQEHVDSLILRINPRDEHGRSSLDHLASHRPLTDDQHELLARQHGFIYLGPIDKNLNITAQISSSGELDVKGFGYAVWHGSLDGEVEPGEIDPTRRALEKSIRDIMPNAPIGRGHSHDYQRHAEIMGHLDQMLPLAREAQAQGVLDGR